MGLDTTGTNDLDEAEQAASASYLEYKFRQKNGVPVEVIHHAFKWQFLFYIFMYFAKINQCRLAQSPKLQAYCEMFMGSIIFFSSAGSSDTSASAASLSVFGGRATFRNF